jgi:hypothetical protein
VPDKEEPEILLGRNIIGRLVVLPRDTLVGNGVDALRAVPALPLENFLLYGDPIQTVCG